MSDMPGFARAQRAWENREPDWADECICEPRYECPDCGADHFTAADVGTDCPDPECSDGGPVAKIATVEHGTPVSGCREHGWCGGCTSRNCDDCNG